MDGELGSTFRGEDRRSGAADRRDPARAHLAAPAVERRRGPRRRPLPRSRWRDLPSLGLALVLGVLCAVALGPRAPAAGIAWGELRARADARSERATEALAELRAAESLRDEAEALTPAGVALDEDAHEVWLPRLAVIDARIADPTTPEPVRRELRATQAALALLGLGG